MNKVKTKGINNVEATQLGVTNDESVEEARVIIGEKIKSLDIIISNAGIYGGYPQADLVQQ